MALMHTPRRTRPALSVTTRTRDARGREVPLVPAPTWRDWCPFFWWRRERAVKAAGEPWIAELRIAKEIGSAYGLLAGVFFFASYYLARTYIQPAFAALPGWLPGLMTATVLAVARPGAGRDGDQHPPRARLARAAGPRRPRGAPTSLITGEGGAARAVRAEGRASQALRDHRRRCSRRCARAAAAGGGSPARRL